MLILFAAVHFPDTFMNRPHPVIWRMHLGVYCAYMLIIAFLHF